MAITATAKAAHRRRRRLFEILTTRRAASRPPIIALHTPHRAPAGLSAGALDVPGDLEIADHITLLGRDCTQLLAGAPER
jgi:hypothetical protein